MYPGAIFAGTGDEPKVAEVEAPAELEVASFSSSSSEGDPEDTLIEDGPESGGVEA